MAKRGDAPAARARDLRDQAIPVEAVEQAADLGTLLFLVRPKSIGQLGAEVAVREAVHGVLPAQESDEQRVIGAGHGMEGLDGAASAGVFAGGDSVQPPQPWGRIVHLSQGVEVPRVALL